MSLFLSALIIQTGFVAWTEAEAVKSTTAFSRVTITQVKGGWQFIVDGAPFRVKGIGCNDVVGWDNIDFLKMAREMGANTLRTWYAVHDADLYYRRAQAYGLRVNQGIHLPSIRPEMSESYTDKAFRKKMWEESLAVIRRFKNEPALLAWTVGNETIAFSEKESERKAFAKFLEELVHAIKQEDPNHPVLYACAAAVDLPYLAESVPSLDAIGLNVYGGLPVIAEKVKKLGIHKPILVTEFGPAGAWDQPKDKNGLPYEPLDQFKAKDYAETWAQIESLGPRCLGGIAFLLGYPRNQDSLDWFNVNAAGTRRKSYWTLYELYTGEKPPNLPPVITQFKISPTNGVRSGDTIEAITKVQDPDGDEVLFTFMVTEIKSDPVKVEWPRVAEINVEKPAFGIARITSRFPGPGYYRVNVYASDGKKNAAVATQSVVVVAGENSNEETSAPQ